ncbi:hypothetical protein B0J12DRAFT_666307 [Macrophomina phaseolina]|uniref:Zn(2)-C6 fungal-type domain-containing protein n=1 Tax=Macrophomina phaseolina TaxID=35725 RepID=A0ABQ8G7C4_9PEZI|nr:hypothetical protein B0J12DRAFT_666307 [Macrophomina phaseolina]
MDPEAASPSQQPRMARACEACRAAKLKCRASGHVGVCKRCIESKRECVVNSSPCRRRARQSRLITDHPRAQRPTQPATFTIDVPIPADGTPDNALGVLCDEHERFIDRLVPPAAVDDAMPSALYPVPSPASAPATSAPSISSNGSTMRGISIPAQFSLDSALALLSSFRHMLPNYPCVALPEEASVPSLAREQPFLLLAMLAAASGSRTLNGHGLYDEEFRKMLAFRYVMAGERSLELLQGLIIYCAWYPVHLRPKDKRVSQYIRIAVDIVSDLELDNAADGPLPSPQSSGLDKLRTLLATYLLVSTHAISRNQATTLPFSSWISKCCDTLGQQHSLSQDKVLVSLVRMQHIIEQAPVTLAETEICLRQVEADMGPEIISMPSIDTALLFTRIVTLASPLLTTFQRKPSSRATACSPLLTAAQLASCIPFARAFFAAILALPRAHLTCFSSLDWARFVLGMWTPRGASSASNNCWRRCASWVGGRGRSGTPTRLGASKGTLRTWWPRCK